MKIRWRLSVFCILLALTCVVSVGRIYAADAVKQDVKFTTNISQDELDKIEGKTDDDSLVVDLYRVAEIEWDGTIGKYLFSSEEPTIMNLFRDSEAFEEKEGRYYVKGEYTDGERSEELADALEGLAAQFAEIVLKNDSGFGPVDHASVNAMDATTLDRALYIAVTRPAGYSDLDDYLVNDNDECKTFANSFDLVYTFDPILIPVTKEDFTISIKYSTDTRYGDLKIVKILERIVVDNPGTFVFHVTAQKEGKKVYEDYHSFTFYDAGQQELVIEGKIPMGATVTVTEEYSGSTYALKSVELSSGEAPLVILPADEEGNIATATFTNDFSDTHTKGYGVRNEYDVIEGVLTFNRNDLKKGGTES